LAQPIKRRNYASQYVVRAAELLGAFQGNYIADIFHHAYHFLFAHAVDTDRTHIGVGHIMTTLAELISLRIRLTTSLKCCTSSLVLLQQGVKHPAEALFFYQYRQFCKFIYAFSRRERRIA
jgi:hypothetical protein